MTRSTLFKLTALPVIAAAALWAGCSNQKSTVPDAAALETFASPEDAVVALISTARKGDVDLLVPMFGERLADMEADSKDRTNGDLQRLAAAYDLKHELITEEDGSVTLVVGLKGWEFPAPLVNDNGRWRFDAETGAAEIHHRRIVRNESGASQFLVDCVGAQRQFQSMSAARGDKAQAYATTFLSSPGKRDGLYWDDSMGSPRSPLGPVAAEAFESGELKRGDTTHPYHGYRYRVLTRQGAGAMGGAKSYLDSSGRLTGGFALVAFPDSYGESGVMTFMVSSDGTLYQKDLGEQTGETARAMASFDPAGWEKVAP